MELGAWMYLIRSHMHRNSESLGCHHHNVLFVYSGAVDFHAMQVRATPHLQGGLVTFSITHAFVIWWLLCIHFPSIATSYIMHFLLCTKSPLLPALPAAICGWYGTPYCTEQQSLEFVTSLPWSRSLSFHSQSICLPCRHLLGTAV